MHPIIIIWLVLACIAVAGWGYVVFGVVASIYRDFTVALQAQTDVLALSERHLSAIHQQLADTHDVVQPFTQHIAAIRHTLESVVRPESRPVTLEAPQVPIPHGEPKTLLLMNDDRTVAHRVTSHRDVPNTYAYGGRVFQRGSDDPPNDEGSWEFLPC